MERVRGDATLRDTAVRAAACGRANHATDSVLCDMWRRTEGAPSRSKTPIPSRLADTGHLHHPTCPSYEPPPGQSGLGEVLGEAVIERARPTVSRCDSSFR
jgi:hypothetical protein